MYQRYPTRLWVWTGNCGTTDWGTEAADLYFDRSAKGLSGNSLVTIASRFRNCDPDLHSDYIRFGDPVVVEEFNGRMREDYASVVGEVKNYADQYLDLEVNGKWLVRALMELVEKDSLIQDNAKFMAIPGGLPAYKQEFPEMHVVIPGKTPKIQRISTIKKSKVNKKDIYKGAFSDSSLESAFQFYLLVRSQNWGEISDEQVNALREDLLSLSSDLAEQKAILNKAAAGGWKNLYPVQSKRRPKTKKQPEKQGKFKNFEEREYEDMTDLTRKLMQR